MIAQKGMTKENMVDLWRQSDSKQYIWSIEHILPQGENIPDNWVDMIADGNRQLAKNLRTEYVHTLGNLTISGYNSNLGNKGFIDKRDRKNNEGKYIGYRNGLNLNADLISKDKWTISDIKSRTDYLVDFVLDLFKL